MTVVTKDAGSKRITVVTKDNGSRRLEFDPKRLENFIRKAGSEFPNLELERFIEKVVKSVGSKAEISAEQITNQLILEGLSNVSMEEPDWTFLCSRLFLKSLYHQASTNRAYDASAKYGSFFGLLKTLGAKGIYSSILLKEYSKEEITELGKEIDPDKDKLFTYIGLKTLADRYLATDHERNVYELPQERFLIIAMVLMVHEDRARRLELVKEAYWALSNLYMTVATPTLKSAGIGYGGQLSSCFIDSVDDSLRGIYDSNTDLATVSKNGGGIGVYLGKIRSRGSDIKGFKGISNGVISWMKQLNNTAVSVDQLGQRQGAIAVYLDIWHKDIEIFLDSKLNNGDTRLRTHDLFHGVCIPDLFMEKLQEKDENGKSIGEWYLFDPHEVRKVMGVSLEDYFDEKKGKGSFREMYWNCVNHPTLTKRRVLAMDIMKKIMKSQLETGTPYMFYRDEVNRQNANKHAGLVYCSNLCTEITQNQSPTTVSEEYTSDGKIIIVKKPGDFVVCNLSSVNLSRAVIDEVLQRLIKIQVRMLDNVIDLNDIPVLQAQLTNKKYRAVGLGTYGFHHLLALKGITWESDEAVKFVDELYEKIAYYAIQASMELSKEKGWYQVFQNSEWHTGDYFKRKNYKSHDDLDWDTLKDEVSRNGVRNAYLMAVAPNSSKFCSLVA